RRTWRAPGGWSLMSTEAATGGGAKPRGGGPCRASRCSGPSRPDSLPPFERLPEPPTPDVGENPPYRPQPFSPLVPTDSPLALDRRGSGTRGGRRRPTRSAPPGWGFRSRPPGGQAHDLVPGRPPAARPAAGAVGHALPPPGGGQVRVQHHGAPR